MCTPAKSKDPSPLFALLVTPIFHYVLFLAGFVDPFSIAGVFVGPEFWETYDGLCHLVGSICLISCVCSLWSIAAISLNRYILICRQNIYARIFTLKKTVGIALVLWFGAFLLDLPNFLGWGDHVYDMKTMACSYDRLANYSYTVFFIAMFVVIPLMTVLVCNVKIYILVVRSKLRIAAHKAGRSMPTEGQSVNYIILDDPTVSGSVVNQTMHSDLRSQMTSPSQKMPNTLQPPAQLTQVEVRSSRTDATGSPPGGVGTISSKKRPKMNMSQEVKLAKTLFIIFIVFCLCWTPYALLCLIDKDDRVMRDAYAMAILLAHTSSTINSIMYAATNKTFRDGYKAFLKKCGCGCLFRADKKASGGRRVILPPQQQVTRAGDGLSVQQREASA